MAYGTKGTLWPNGVIPYEIDEGDFPPGTDDRADIDQAITAWNARTVITLVPRINEANYVVFKDVDQSCASTIGQKGGNQQITCDLEGNFSPGSIIHEIGHAVGLHHEHQRPDRLSFVTVQSNADTTNCALVTGQRILTDYDCNSIMHYGTGGCGGITPINGCQGVSQGNNLTARDTWGVSILYGIPIRSAVVWEDDSDVNGYYQVHSSAFAANGRPCYLALTINKDAAGQQRKPEVGMAGDGTIIVVWEDDTDNNGNSQIKMRGFRDGRQVISQRTVNTVAAGNQCAPDIAVANDGSFVVVWQDDADGNEYYQIKMRGFNSDGSERFSQRTVNPVAAGQQTSPRVAIAPNGFFVVVWEDAPGKKGNKDLLMRGFNADASQSWPFQRVSSRTGGVRRCPQIAMGILGDFVVVWEDDTDNNEKYQIRMRAFFANSQQMWAERTVNTVAKGQQLSPDIAIGKDFQPVVVWSDNSEPKKDYEIKMRGFTSVGGERFSQTTVNTDEEGRQRNPRIAMEANGRFTVVWEDDIDNDGKSKIRIRGFEKDGQELFSTREVSTRLDGQKAFPSVVSPAMGLLNPF